MQQSRVFDQAERATVGSVNRGFGELTIDALFLFDIRSAQIRVNNGTLRDKFLNSS